MLIDVIIPTFNRAYILERSIQSVLDQSYKNFILHIVDDGSTDETAKLLTQYLNHPQVCLYHSKNGGVSHARNLAAKNAKGEWLSFLDSDDEWLPEKLLEQTNYLKKNPHCDFLHSEEIWIRNGVRVNPKVKHQKNANDDFFFRSLRFCLISPSTVLMRKSLFDEYQGFDESMTVCEDFDLWNKILAHKKVHFLDKPLAKKYGGHEDQLSTHYVAMDYWRIKSLIKLYLSSGISEKTKEEIRKVVSSKSDLLLKNYLKHNNHNHYEEIKKLTLSIMPDV